MSLSTILCARRGGAAQAIPEGVQPFFEDNLEGGQFNSANGFVWGPDGIGDWVVTDEVGGVNGGTHSACITYGPDAANSAGKQATANLEFSTGRDVVDLGIEYWIRFQNPYEHRIRVGESENNKFFGIWRDYVNNLDGFRAVLETNPTSFSEDSPSSVARTAASSSASNLFDQPQLSDNLIGTGFPIVPGVFTRIRLRFRGATAALANDGVLYWKAGDTVICSIANGDYWNQNETYANVRFNFGYFMGSSNSGSTLAQKVYLAGFKFFDLNGAGWP